MDNRTCFACGEEGHVRAQCPARRTPPVPTSLSAQLAAASRSRHLADIREIVNAWQDGLLTLEQKRRAIVDANLEHYGGHRGALTRMP